MSLSVIIIDDEPIARKGVRRLLNAESDVEIIGECGDGLEALEVIIQKKPDIAILDIQMPELNGFQVLEALEQTQMPIVIFVTAYDEFALKAFEVHALDYLLKPLKQEQFHLALEKARAMLLYKQKRGFDKKVEDLLATVLPKKSFQERFIIKTNKGIILVEAKELDWIEAYGDYVRLHSGEKKHLLRKKISDLELALDPVKFARVHRSSIVRIDRIKEMRPLTNGDYVLTLANGAKLSLSRTYSAKVLSQLEGLA